MRAIAYSFMFLLVLPVSGLAQEERLKVYLKMGFEVANDKGIPISTEELAFDVAEVDQLNPARLKVMTGHGISGWLNRSEVYESPEEVVDDYTELIRAAKNQSIPDGTLASYYKYRGVAWRQFNKNEQEFIKVLESYVGNPKNSDRKRKLMQADRKFKKQVLWTAKLAIVDSSLRYEKAPPSDLAQVDADIKDFSESLRLSPVQADVYLLRGLAWLEKGHEGNRTAAEEKKRGLLLFYLGLLNQEDHNVLLSYIGLSLKGDLKAKEYDVMVEKYYDEAVNDFDRALRLRETSALAYFGRGQARHGRWQLTFKKEIGDLIKRKDELNQKKIKAAGVDPEAALAPKKAALSKANRNFTLANEVYALEKENWLRANVDLAKAKKAFFLHTKQSFDRAEIAFNDAKSEWTKARADVAAAEQDLEVATAKKAKPVVKKAKPAANKNGATPKVVLDPKVVTDESAQNTDKMDLENAAKSALEAIQTEMEQVLGDFNDVLRVEPNAVKAAIKREEAIRDWERAKAELRQYLSSAN